MSIGTYITIADITHVQFGRYPDTIKQKYVDEANEEIEDLAKRLGITVEDIVDPIHFKVKRYAQNYLLSRFAEDMIGTNQVPVGETDIYKDLFERSQYLMRNNKLDVTAVMFTGDEETPDNRAVTFQRIYRG
jgi:hypothetical protein